MSSGLGDAVADSTLITSDMVSAFRPRRKRWQPRRPLGCFTKVLEGNTFSVFGSNFLENNPGV